MARCQCEHSKHGDSGCQGLDSFPYTTDYGTFHVCLSCRDAECMPRKEVPPSKSPKLQVILHEPATLDDGSGQAHSVDCNNVAIWQEEGGTAYFADLNEVDDGTLIRKYATVPVGDISEIVALSDHILELEVENRVKALNEIKEVLRICLKELEDWNRGHEPSEGQIAATEIFSRIKGA